MWRKFRFQLIENKKNDLLWLLLHNAVQPSKLGVTSIPTVVLFAPELKLISIVLSIVFVLVKFGVFLPLFFPVFRVPLLLLPLSLFSFLLLIFLILVSPFITIFWLQFCFLYGNHVIWLLSATAL